MNRSARTRSAAVRLLLGAVCCALAVGGSGCAKPTARVSGTAKFRGKLLTSGVVVFVERETNRPTPPAYIRSDGTYVVPVAQVGPAVVLIQTPRPIRPEGLPRDSPEYKEYEIQSATYVEIPIRFVDLKAAVVATDLQSGDNVFDIDLSE